MSNVNYLDLAGKVAVVTGAGGGIGRAVVAALSKQGARVVATDRDSAAMAGVDADCRELDVTRPAAIRALADAVAAEYGALDIWVNNAGYMDRMPALDLDEAAWQRTQDINLKGTFFGAQAAARHGGAAQRRHHQPVQLCRREAASELRGLCQRQGGRGPSDAMPGAGMEPHGPARERHRAGLHRNADEQLDACRRGHPRRIHRPPAARRLGQPAEIADAVLYLASQASAYVTGHVLLVDGGVSKT